MIPPCDPSILTTNPQFKALHQQLTTAILNPDASTRAHDADPGRRAVQADLKKYLIRAVKARILRRVVGQLAHDERVDDELRPLLSIIALYLQQQPGSMADTTDLLSLLTPDLNKFQSAIPSLTPNITSILSADLAHLKSLANAAPPNTNTTTISTTTSNPTSKPPRNRLRPLSLKPTSPTTSLTTTLTARLHTLRATQSSELPAARTKMTSTAASVLAAHAHVMERGVHVLERTKHGGLARAGRARAEQLRCVIEGIRGKGVIMRHEMLSAIYTPETKGALAHYHDHLDETRRRLEGRKEDALAELERYERADLGGDLGGESEDGKAGAMVEIARRYGALVREAEGVRMEIRRLGG